MILRLRWLMAFGTFWLAGCQCASEDVVAPGSDGSSTSQNETSSGAAVSASDSTGAPFDASRWIGRYHYENVFLPFGERGDPFGTYALINFEIFADSRATLYYDSCGFEEPVIRNYGWEPDEEGWIVLQPGTDEPWLRHLGPDPVSSIRVQLVEPCRELWFEVDGWVNRSFPFSPGASCWVDRCTTPIVMQVDYCEGEEPPPCP